MNLANHKTALALFLLLLGYMAPAADSNLITRAADQLLARQASDGAISTRADSPDDSKVVPYFANSAALGLVAAFAHSGNRPYLMAAKCWVAWYEAHINPDGTINDYSGTPGHWTSTGGYDSTDAYAATYLDLLLAIHCSEPDNSWLAARLPSARRALAAIRLTLQPNGLTHAKPGYPIVFLMDNTETARGLRALAAMADELAQPELARDTRQLARILQDALTRLSWFPEDNLYSQALDKTGKPLPFTGKWYPDIMANLMAVSWLPYSPGHRALLARLKARFPAEIPATARTEADLERLVWWGFAARGAGDMDLLQEIGRKLTTFDPAQPVANPALLGHLCRLLADIPTPRATPPGKIREHYDVIIAGAGTGGFGAAVQAARLGATVLLVEETDWIGGQMNAAGVTSMDEGPKHKDRPYVLVRERGVYHEFAREVTDHYQAQGISADTAYWNARLGLEPRVGQDILYQMLHAARAHTPALDVLLRASVTKVHQQGTAVSGVSLRIVTDRGSVIRTIRTRVLMDATEWGDVIPLTGMAYRVGNCTNGAVDPTRAIQELTWTAVAKQYPRGTPMELLLTNPPPGYDAMHPKFLKSLVVGDESAMSKIPWTFTTWSSPETNLVLLVGC